MIDVSPLQLKYLELQTSSCQLMLQMLSFSELQECSLFLGLHSLGFFFSPSWTDSGIQVSSAPVSILNLIWVPQTSIVVNHFLKSTSLGAETAPRNTSEESLSSPCCSTAATTLLSHTLAKCPFFGHLRHTASLAGSDFPHLWHVAFGVAVCPFLFCCSFFL